MANALDVLAQQTVAAVAMAPEGDGLPADAWYATVRRSACYEGLPRSAFDAVLAMLAGRFESGDLADYAPRLMWDEFTGVLKARPGSQRLAVTAAGTIPDRGLYPAVLARRRRIAAVLGGARPWGSGARAMRRVACDRRFGRRGGEPRGLAGLLRCAP